MPRLEKLFGVKNWSFLRNAYFFSLVITIITVIDVILQMLQMCNIFRLVLCLSVMTYMMWVMHTKSQPENLKGRYHMEDWDTAGE